MVTLHRLIVKAGGKSWGEEICCFRKKTFSALYVTVMYKVLSEKAPPPRYLEISSVSPALETWSAENF